MSFFVAFIAIIFSVLIEFGFKSIESWRQFNWFEQLTDWVLHRAQNTSWRDGPIAVIAILLPVVAGVWLVAAMLSDVWILGFIFSVVILSLSLGPMDPIRQVQEYLQAVQRDDTSAANNAAASFLGHSVDGEPLVVATTVKEQLFVRVCSGIIGVFFWFVILGPVGAALFRAACLLQERYRDVQGGLADAIADLNKILLWIPARLCVLSFAIAGNFVDTLQSLRHFSDLWRKDSESLLSETGLGAIHSRDQSDDNKIDVDHLVDCVALAKRSVLAWLTFLELVIIFSVLM